MPLVWAGAEMGDGRGRRPEAAHHASPREDEPGRGTKGPPPSWPPPPAVLGILLDCKAQTRPPDLGHSEQSSKVWWQDPFTSVKTTERGGREAQETRDTHPPPTHTHLQTHTHACMHELPCSSDGKEICL